METIKEAKEHLKSNYKKGCICPVCNQSVKLYKRKFYATQARSLILLNKLNSSKEWVHSREIMKVINITGDFAKMSYWGLITEQLNSDKEKRSSGFWKITSKGKQFVNNQIKILSHTLIYNGKIIGFSKDEISIIDSLGKKFNYNELMSN